MNSLGFIETKGLLAAVEGADAMLKAADVSLLEKNISGGGLVTITVSGEVSAVQASVEAGTAAIGRIEGAELVSRHVIARPYEELDKIIATSVPVVESEEISRVIAQVPVSVAEQDESVPAEEKVETPEPVKEETEVETVQEFVPVAPAAPEVKEAAPAKDSTPKYRAAELRKMKISKVRQIARNLDGISMTNEDVKKATKKTLIDAIINVTRQIEE